MSQLTDRFYEETDHLAISQRGMLVYHTRAYVNWLEKLVEGVQAQPPNNARDEICPYLDKWTIIDANGVVQYKIPACIKGGQTSPIA